MTIFGTYFSAGALWLAGALVLAILELAAPGFFLIFVGAGAALTGFVLLAAPGLPWIAQALLFGAFGAAAVAVGRRWYHRDPAVQVSHGLNDRAANLVGRTVEVLEPIIGGEGRVKVGDGAWNAQGPDMPAGALARVTGVAGSVLLVERV